MDTASTHRWASRRTILRSFTIPERKLTDLVRQGYVRVVKFGTSRQAAMVYSIADVEATLSALAQGRTPRRAVGQSGPGAGAQVGKKPTGRGGAADSGGPRP